MNGRATPQEGLFAQLLDVGVATLGGVGAALLPSILHEITIMNVVGPAFTVACEPGDVLGIHGALAFAPAGSVLVVDAPGDFSYWGEVATVAAHVRNLRGLVIDGFVNDVDRMRDLEFPVFANGISARGARATDAGRVDVPITIGTVTITSGDVVVGDTDGVAVIAAAEVDTVLARAVERMEGEADLIERIRSGELTADIFGLDVSAVRGGED